MAVGRGGEHRARRGDAAAARVVLHHHALAELLAELLGDQPRGGVADAAGAEGDDEADGLAGVGLLGLRDAGGQCTLGQRQSRQHQHASSGD